MTVKNSDLKKIREAAKKSGHPTEEEMDEVRGTKKKKSTESDPWDQSVEAAAGSVDPWDATEEKDPWDDDTPEDRPMVTAKGLLQGAVDSLPVAGSLFGGAGGFLTPAPGGLIMGAAAGAYAGKAAENFIEHNFMGQPKSRTEIWADPAVEAVKGAASEAGGQVAGKGFRYLRGMGEQSTPITTQSGSFRNKPPSTDNLPMPQKPAAQRYVPVGEGPRDFSEMGFEQLPKDNADEIATSAARIGARATPGMLSSNPNIQNLESILSQKPSVYGQKVRDSYTPIFKGLKNTSEDLVKAPETTPLSTGDRVKEGLMSRVRAKSAPLSKSFDDIRGSTSNIQPDPKNLNRTAQRLQSQPIAQVEGLPQTQAIKKYSTMIQNAKNLDELKQIRTGVNEELTSAYMTGRGQEAHSLKKVKEAINRLERREIIKAAQSSMPTKLQGDKAAKHLIDQMKATNKGWAVLMTELQAVAKAGGIGRKIGSPEHFIRLVEEIPSEKLSERMFNLKNYKGLNEIKKFAPDEFEALRQHQLNRIAKKSMTNGQIDHVKLIKNMDEIGPEARNLVFGPSSNQALQDLKNITYSIPKKVGASDTPRGTMWDKFTDNPMQIVNPFIWGRELGNAYSYMLLQGGKLATIRSGAGQLQRGLLTPAKSTGGLLMMKKGRESEE
jgi:hypothetical protein